MKKTRRAKGLTPFKWGIITIAFLTAVTYLAFTKRIPFINHPYQVKAVFSTGLSSLAKGAPVRIAGVNVGKVKGVSHGPGGTAIVTMTIDSQGLPLHTDSTIKLRPRLFLEGNFFVDVTPGTPAAPVLGDGKTIPITQTAVPVQLDQVLDSLNHNIRGQTQVLVDKFGTALSAGGAQAINASFPYFKGAFRGTAITSKSFRGTQPGDLIGFIRAQAAVSGALASRDTQLEGLLVGFDRTVTALAGVHVQVADTLTAAASTFRTAPPALRVLQSALPSLRRFSVDVKPTLRALPATLDDSRDFLKAANEVLAPSAVPQLISTLRPVARQFPPLTPELVDLFNLVTPVSNCINNNILPELYSKLNDGPLTTGHPLWQDFLHLWVGLTSANQNFDGNGPYIRYLAGAATNAVSVNVPGLQNVLGLLQNASSGLTNNPQYIPGQTPPFHPEIPCETQPLQSLSSSNARSVQGTPVAPHQPQSAAANAAAAHLALARTQQLAKKPPAAVARLLHVPKAKPR